MPHALAAVPSSLDRDYETNTIYIFFAYIYRLLYYDYYYYFLKKKNMKIIYFSINDFSRHSIGNIVCFNYFSLSISARYTKST